MLNSNFSLPPPFFTVLDNGATTVSLLFSVSEVVSVLETLAVPTLGLSLITSRVPSLILQRLHERLCP